jgi:hypothetical protein
MTEPAYEAPPPEDPAFVRARRGRNIVIAVGLVLFVILVYVVTVIKMGANVLDRAL